ncbi:MAG: FHA domain-containing protein [Actinobacteria bacterium]|nr:FHA domain-containing protein [Actinomycetota bacterium]
MKDLNNNPSNNRESIEARETKDKDIKNTDQFKTESIEGKIESAEVCGDILEDLKKIPEGRAGIIVIKGPNVGEKFFLSNIDKKEFRIGRSPDSDILLDDITVSRRHAVLEKHKEGYRISDLGSLNGSYVNGKRVENSVLNNGDKIQIGKYVFLFFSH